MFRKYSHSLGPESLEFLEDLLDTHHILDEDVEFSIEWFAKEYNKQDGMCSSNIFAVIILYLISADAQMKISLDILKRVYETFQNGGDSRSQEEPTLLDPESHMFVVNAFDMPLWNWSQERSTFER